ncbi:hypothetical protein ABRQ07_19970 [Pectobacterium polonicum]|uniref:Uncharacterized protein n=1 Tax=Pectobacterium polonicum TaxID=2485124 RepID=A0ABV1PFF6_9GAMM|nr:hypothetical protein [Pectobacterium polonicum]MDC9821110.1 hypothetical protein [Pectobacterium polonicum]
MVTWEYHDFDDYTGNGELLMRQFIVGGMVYAIGFQKLQSVDELLNKGIDEKHNIPGFQMPQSGLWTVAFDKVENQERLEAYRHVELNSGQILKVITSVARAIFDHYNVSQSGAYYWCAASDLSGKRVIDLTDLYDGLLGLAGKNRFNIRIPGMRSFNRLGSDRRGYVILTRYYDVKSSRTGIFRFWEKTANGGA